MNLFTAIDTVGLSLMSFVYHMCLNPEVQNKVTKTTCAGVVFQVAVCFLLHIFKFELKSLLFGVTSDSHEL